MFNRKILKLYKGGQAEDINETAQQPTALVVNSSHVMAKEITFELSASVPNCSIMYAPTIELAKLILGKRFISLVVSEPVLPDGSVSLLAEYMEKIEAPPDLVVIGAPFSKRKEILSRSTYRFRVLWELVSGIEIEADGKNRSIDSVSTLGADLRNDLNNPLQEIVAMAFVAKSTGELSSTTVTALDAIQRAAKSMSGVVNRIEDKIRGVVG